MARTYGQQSLAITNSASTTAVLSMGGYAAMHVIVPAGSSITSLTFRKVYKAADGSDTTLANAHKDASGNGIAMAVAAGNSYTAPYDLLAGSRYAIVGDASGTIFVEGKE